MQRSQTNPNHAEPATPMPPDAGGPQDVRGTAASLVEAKPIVAATNEASTTGMPAGLPADAAGRPPTLWGRTALELHDLAWHSIGVTVVRAPRTIDGNDGPAARVHTLARIDAVPDCALHAWLLLPADAMLATEAFFAPAPSGMLSPETMRGIDPRRIRRTAPRTLPTLRGDLDHELRMIAARPSEAPRRTEVAAIARSTARLELDADGRVRRIVRDHEDERIAAAIITADAAIARAWAVGTAEAARRLDARRRTTIDLGAAASTDAPVGADAAFTLLAGHPAMLAAAAGEIARRLGTDRSDGSQASREGPIGIAPMPRRDDPRLRIDERRLSARLGRGRAADPATALAPGIDAGAVHPHVAVLGPVFVGDATTVTAEPPAPVRGAAPVGLLLTGPRVIPDGVRMTMLPDGRTRTRRSETATGDAWSPAHAGAMPPIAPCSSAPAEWTGRASTDCAQCPAADSPAAGFAPVRRPAAMTGGHEPHGGVLRRAFHATAAAAMLLAALPVMALVALVVLLEDGRPVLFGHERQTRGGRRFTCWKFRTMVRDAERLKRSLAGVNACDGPQFHISDDPRLLRSGRLLRRFHLDELPQLWNVVRGDMDLVGPRPSPDEENRLCPAWREARLSVRPGLTGLWQIRRTRAPGLDFQEWIRWDLRYVHDRGPGMDLAILWQTFVGMLPGNWSPQKRRQERELIPAEALTRAAGTDRAAVRATTSPPHTTANVKTTATTVTTATTGPRPTAPRSVPAPVAGTKAEAIEAKPAPSRDSIDTDPIGRIASAAVADRRRVDAA